MTGVSDSISAAVIMNCCHIYIPFVQLLTLHTNIKPLVISNQRRKNVHLEYSYP